MSKNNRRDDREKIENLLGEMDVDVDLGSTDSHIKGLDEVDLDSDFDAVDVSSTNISVVKEFDPEKSSESPGDITREFLLDGGSRVTVTVKTRPKCPNCSYVPLEDDEPVSLTGTCTECGTRVCPQCRNDCAACGTILCSSCTQGHGTVDETYCPICRQDVQNKVEHERRLDERDQRHRQEIELAELKMQFEKQRKELEIKAQQKRFENSAELKRLKKELLETKKELKMRLEEHEKDMKLKESEITKNRFKSLENRANNIKSGKDDRGGNNV